MVGFCALYVDEREMTKAEYRMLRQGPMGNKVGPVDSNLTVLSVNLSVRFSAKTRRSENSWRVSSP